MIRINSVPTVNKKGREMEAANISIQIKNIALAEQCKIGVVLTMADGFKGCFFCDDIEDAEWLTWEMNDAISLSSQSMFDEAIEQIRPRIGMKLKDYLS
jgi:hypothetical protein